MLESTSLSCVDPKYYFRIYVLLFFCFTYSYHKTFFKENEWWFYKQNLDDLIIIDHISVSYCIYSEEKIWQPAHNLYFPIISCQDSYKICNRYRIVDYPNEWSCHIFHRLTSFGNDSMDFPSVKFHRYSLQFFQNISHVGLVKLYCPTHASYYLCRLWAINVLQQS